MRKKPPRAGRTSVRFFRSARRVGRGTGPAAVGTEVGDADLVMANDDVARVDKGDGEEIGVDRHADGLHLRLPPVLVTLITLPCVGAATASCPTRPDLISVGGHDAIKARKDRPA
jgi:hypothetical protein